MTMRWDSPSDSMRTATVSPGGEKSTAFSSRLVIAALSMNGSPCAIAGSGASSSDIFTPAISAIAMDSETTLPNSRRRSITSETSSAALPSMTESSRSFASRRSARSASAEMFPRNRRLSPSAIAPGSSLSSSAAPRIAANGLFISCVNVCTYLSANCLPSSDSRIDSSAPAKVFTSLPSPR